MEPKTYTFEIVVPSELAAGITGFTDTVTITVESGDPGGDEGEFDEFIKCCLGDWYDGGDVEQV